LCTDSTVLPLAQISEAAALLQLTLRSNLEVSEMKHCNGRTKSPYYALISSSSCKPHYCAMAALCYCSVKQAPAAERIIALPVLGIYRPHLSSDAYRRHAATVRKDHPATMTTSVDCSRAVCIGGNCLKFHLTTL
jgi:hypothetical protein